MALPLTYTFDCAHPDGLPLITIAASQMKIVDSYRTMDRNLLNRRIPIRVKSQILLVDPATIDCVEACGNYVRLRIEEKAYLTRGTITAYEERLAPYGFLRVHRSVLVNITQVVSLETSASGDHVIHLASGHDVTLSRKYRDQFFAFLSDGERRSA